MKKRKPKNAAPKGPPKAEAAGEPTSEKAKTTAGANPRPVPLPRRSRLELEERNGITVVRFVDRKLLDEQNIQYIGEDLFAIVDKLHRRCVVLDFGSVDYMASKMLEKLITMNKKVQSANGKLVICGINEDVFEVFEITRLDRLFGVVDTLQSALNCFAQVAVYIACPLFGCRGQAVCRQQLKNQAPSGWSDCCSACGSVIRIGGPADAMENCAVVSDFSLPTYADERIEGSLHRQFSANSTGQGTDVQTLKAIGRLDLFAYEALERAWRTLPAPRQVLFDLREVTDLSSKAAAAVLALCSNSKDESKASILIDLAKPNQAGAFPLNPPVYHQEMAAWLPFCDVPITTSELTVQLKQVF